MNTGVYRFQVHDIVHQLRFTLDLLEWIVTQVPTDWVLRPPTGVIRGLEAETFSVVYHLAHLGIYEQRLANPVLAELEQGRDGSRVAASGHLSPLKSEIDALSEKPVPEILDMLRRQRQLHIDIVQRFDDAKLNRPLTTLWGTGPGGCRPESAGWVAAKTAQHTLEHANSIYRIALFNPD